jgi:hypothetical protein
MQKLSCSECKSTHGVLECYHNGTLVIVEWYCLDCKSTTDICSADVQHLLVEVEAGKQESISGIELDDSTYVVRGPM